MKLGIIITTGPENGGTYFYSISILNALRNFGMGYEIFVFYDSNELPVDEYQLSDWILIKYPKNDTKIIKLLRFLSLTELGIFRNLSSGRHSLLKKYNLDLVICPSTTLAAYWCKIPYIVAVHDVYHRYSYPGNSFLKEPFRDQQWRIASKNAEIVMVESDLGKIQLQEAYNIPDARIRKQPTGPAPFIWNFKPEMQQIIREKYKLPENYVFYPGGFNPGKNQKCIVQAIAHLKQVNNIEIHALFAGPYNPYCDEIKQMSVNLDIENLIHILGLVPDDDMVYLYKNALALIMASYTGPTNMPIWEAFAAGCPVISSNAGEMPDQVGDAGMLFDPSDSTQLSVFIQKVFLDSKFRTEMIVRGYKRIEQIKPENWARNLLSIIEEVSGSI